MTTDSNQCEGDTDRQPHDYDIDKRFAHIRVDVLGQRYTDVIRVCEQFPDLPDGITVYVEHIDAVDLKQENSDESDCYPRASQQWVVYSIHSEGGTGRFLDIADSREEASDLGDKWWKAFHTGEKAEPAGYAGISWAPVADFAEWKEGDDD